MKVSTIIFTVLILPILLAGKTLSVGANETYTTIQDAAKFALAGDTIFVLPGVYQGGMSITKLQGEEVRYIHIFADPSSDVIIRGGGNSIQFVDAKFIKIEGFIIEQQTGNGMNIDDGGDYSTPSEGVIVENCHFRDMNASGNNDMLKMSGVDNFRIINCRFENGASGGSGIDMVGCHRGLINSNSFKNMGSNAIQAKGGTQFIEISANHFENCGQRTLNLGGSTGLEFFRPIDATFEASDLYVYANIFIGSVSPINYVGSQRVDVVNNTIIKPEKWVIRILQETVDESRFVACSEGLFANNIIYIGNLNTETNIGPNTLAESFTFRNNYWYNYDDINWAGPDIPSVDPTQIVGIDPEFSNISSGDFRLRNGSKLIGCIPYDKEPYLDYFGNNFGYPRSAGAIESQTTSIAVGNKDVGLSLYPNPASDYIEINLGGINPMVNHGVDENVEIKIYNTIGECVINYEFQITKYFNNIRIYISSLSSGLYYIEFGGNLEIFIKE